MMIFIAEHPLFTSNPTTLTKINGTTFYPLRDYMEEGPRKVFWLGTNLIKQHHMLSTFINCITKNGMDVIDMEEWAPEDPDKRVRPYSIVIRAKKRMNTLQAAGCQQ
ncbi:hypothetical protein SAMD00019534_000720 [Acytostelium subglobosum LB1]|uniref:hypothetical protein n=1 Tax=Acytostelium subglobosum LB1 TaxID=1410327 RepID=UPI000644FCEB|nr:hypothetical protein SAMD00019534_000720 [Acytostelium subglobosum LB1]GAM16897.1 hypothetical protein SAMD00019534_000720 [Acytostelium subglobosum LB1]|eukprot:XP_012758959.1 hypothetical protein SAMD00019534_000720 [Acytostelium subglobosum LB1]